MSKNLKNLVDEVTYGKCKLFSTIVTLMCLFEMSTNLMIFELSFSFICFPTFVTNNERLIGSTENDIFIILNLFIYVTDFYLLKLLDMDP